MLTQKQIEFLNHICKGRWSEEMNMINVYRSVNISHMNLTRIPVPFNKIDGTFNCSNNRLLTLEGAPITINGTFNCSNNNLNSLQHSPKYVRDHYDCSVNQLTDLKGAPEYIISDFYCRHNKLQNLLGCPSIKGRLFINNNPLTHIWGFNKAGYGILTEYTKQKNKLNQWIQECSYKNIIFPYQDINQNIKWLIETCDNTLLTHLMNSYEYIHECTHENIHENTDTNMSTYANVNTYLKNIIQYKLY